MTTKVWMDPAVKAICLMRRYNIPLGQKDSMVRVFWDLSMEIDSLSLNSKMHKKYKWLLKERHQLIVAFRKDWDKYLMERFGNTLYFDE